MKGQTLLLILFLITISVVGFSYWLVTAPLEVDKGITVKLPPWSDEPPSAMKLNSRNVYSVIVNANDELLVRGEPMDISNLKENTKIFIANPNGLENMSESPDKALISLKNDRGTSYEVYIKVYNELKAAYKELWEEEAQKRFNQSYEELNIPQKKEIRASIPLVISEAEPTDFEE